MSCIKQKAIIFIKVKEKRKLKRKTLRAFEEEKREKIKLQKLKKQFSLKRLNSFVMENFDLNTIEKFSTNKAHWTENHKHVSEKCNSLSKLSHQLWGCMVACPLYNFLSSISRWTQDISFITFQQTFAFVSSLLVFRCVIRSWMRWNYINYA